MRRLLLPALLLLAGCASSREAAQPATASAAELQEAARTWHGTPHRLGGLDRRGIDCSGLVVALYRDVLGADLPRTTAEQARLGAAVRQSALEPGDLVFFRPPKSTRHVGIYLGEGAFVHASSSRGVMTSRLDEPYWRRAYWMARRPTAGGFVAERPLPQPAEPLPPRPVAAPRGW